jgi:hypothetical protein
MNLQRFVIGTGDVHYVNHKLQVEMFGITVGDDAASEAMLQHIVDIQTKLFDSLKLHFRFVTM